MTYVIDATGLLVGRLGTVVAKKALLGEEIVIVNSENAVISGDKYKILEEFRTRVARGVPLRGPYYPRRPDMILRRMIRGMLPHSKPRGREAFKRIMCYIGVPSDYATAKLETVEAAKVKKLPNFKFIDIKTISEEIGYKLK